MNPITFRSIATLALIAFCSSEAAASVDVELEDDVARLSYVATWPDLIQAIGVNAAAADQHYENYGHKERRYTADRFDPVAYLADNADHAAACGFNEATAADPNVQLCGARYYINVGFREGRSWSDLTALAYIASYPDLMRAFGPNADAGRQHYQNHGRRENRWFRFNIVNYLMERPDKFRKYRSNYEEALADFILNAGNLP